MEMLLTLKPHFENQQPISKVTVRIKTVNEVFKSAPGTQQVLICTNQYHQVGLDSL